MAFISVVARSRLATIDVLAPERYDPRRAFDKVATKTILLGDVAKIVRRVIQPSSDLGRCFVLDTSDAREGVVISRKTSVDGSAIGSAKKITEPRDVIISRLRPYLRQVAFVDEQITGAQGAVLACSTEFFVLRAPDGRSIAFLVPFLLSRPVQQVLAASQEGGHHPRFNDSTLLTLPIPMSLVDKRDAISKAIEKSVELYRRYERGVDEMVASAEEAFA
jgi:hypothetical protein